MAKAVGDKITIQQDKHDLVKAKANPHQDRLQTVFAEAVETANELSQKGQN